MGDPKVTKIAFERRYSDDSGVEFGVSLSEGYIIFDHIRKVDFPADELGWLIACLTYIRDTQEAT